MATAEKAKHTPSEPERKFPLYPLVGAVAAFVAQRLSQRPEFNIWLYWLAAGLVGAASLYHLAPRKNGKVVATPFGLDVYGPLAVLGFTALISYSWLKDDNTTSALHLALVVGAFAVIAWGYWLAAQKRGRDFQLLRDRLLVALGACAAFGYANFGHLHFDNFIHTWDTYHYYIGAKYFPENGYERMYECAIVADSEDLPAEKLTKMRAQRIVTNLRTNIMEKVGETILLHPETCKSHFTPDRWALFKKDIAFFRARVNDKRWEEIHHDHGYNASPVWTLLGYAVTNSGPATLDQVVFVDLFDPLYLALMAAMIWWAFGPRVFAVAMLMLGCNWASRFFYWTGGALLRHDWLFYAVAVVCLLKKNRPALAGVALAYATLLRLFPGLLVLGPVLAAVEYARLRYRGEPVEGSAPGPKGHWKELGAALSGHDTSTVAVALALYRKVNAALASKAWPLRARALANEQAALASGHDEIEAATGADAALAVERKTLAAHAERELKRLAVPVPEALPRRLEALAERLARYAPVKRWVDPAFVRFVLGGLVATVLLVGASLHFFGGVESWMKFAANTSKHAATPLTNHMGLRTILSARPWTSGQHLRDSKVLDAWQPWKDRRVEVFKASRPVFLLAAAAGLVLLYLAIRGTRALLWASAAMGAGMIVVGAELTNYYYVFFVALATLHELKREVGLWLTAMVATCIFIMLTPFLGMSGWQDEQSVAMSIVCVIAVGGIWWSFTPRARKWAVEPEAPCALAEAGPAAAPTPVSGGKKKKR